MQDGLEIACMPFLCEYMKDYRTFKEDFFKIIDFCHYLHEEGYDLMKL